MPYLFGRECEAGWGYNARDGSFIEDVDVQNVKEDFTISKASYGCTTTPFGSDDAMPVFTDLMN
uniref:Uncharacterized protein n=1 Tax=Panagrolaimus sp. JU765 TaxID=591449 RepID=A0AC34RRK7_9BILA